MKLLKSFMLGVILLLTGTGMIHAMPKVETILKRLDTLMEMKNDLTAQSILVRQKKGEGVKQYELVFYRRDSDDAFLVVFTAPDSDKGNGYLRVGDNFWMYRRNTRTFQHINRDESINGSDMKAQDMEKRKTSELYKGALDKNGKEMIEATMLGKIPVYKITVVAQVKDVSYPKKIFWVRRDNYLPLKVQNFSLSGTLMQSAYYLKYTKVQGRYVAIKHLFVDEFEKGNKTLMQIKNISFKKVPKSIFTKAYLENLSK